MQQVVDTAPSRSEALGPILAPSGHSADRVARSAPAEKRTYIISCVRCQGWTELPETVFFRSSAALTRLGPAVSFLPSHRGDGGIGLFPGALPETVFFRSSAALIKPPSRRHLLKSVREHIRGISNAYHCSARPFGSFVRVERLLPPQSSGLRGTAAAASASTNQVAVSMPAIGCG